MNNLDSPLYPLLNEINEAVSSGLPFLAVAMTVSLPDICVSLESEDGRTDGKRYQKWCDDNLDREKFSFVSSQDLYSMRCGVLHNGRFGDMKHNVARVIFALPGPGVFTNCVINDAYIYSVDEFCKNFTDAVFRWFEKSKGNPVVAANVPKLMQYRVGGLLPYIGGVTVLA